MNRGSIHLPTSMTKITNFDPVSMATIHYKHSAKQKIFSKFHWIFCTLLFIHNFIVFDAKETINTIKTERRSTLSLANWITQSLKSTNDFTRHPSFNIFFINCADKLTHLLFGVVSNTIIGNYTGFSGQQKGLYTLSNRVKKKTRVNVKAYFSG